MIKLVILYKLISFKIIKGKHENLMESEYNNFSSNFNLLILIVSFQTIVKWLEGFIYFQNLV